MPTPPGRTAGADDAPESAKFSRRTRVGTRGRGLSQSDHRAPPYHEAQVDAQTADLGEGVFDAVFSRFGVMFFSDPVAAFANLRKAVKPQGRLAFLALLSSARSPIAPRARVLSPE